LEATKDLSVSDAPVRMLACEITVRHPDLR
jgi:hypothetical protein